MLQYELSGSADKSINSRKIKKCFKEFNSAAKIKIKQTVSLAFVDSRTIRKFNRAYRGQDKITDVLSFAQRDSDFAGPGEERELGEILICLSRVKSQAKEYGWPIDYEICRLLIHGLAHLVGFEHEGVSKKEAGKMRKFEEKVLLSSRL